MQDALYFGTVIHNRVKPISHKLRYKVFSILIDCDGFGKVADKCRLFSHNRFNIFALYDRDFGDGENLTSYLNGIAEDALGQRMPLRFKMLCYPRIFGYGFNPLTVYYGFDEAERVRLVVYEVRNTFGERKTYALPTEADDDATDTDIIAQSCQKQLYVSPFNDVSGHYHFRLTQPAKELTVGVALKKEDGPVLTAHFRGARRDLSDATLLKALGQMGWMTAKVTAGIHYEALKLWFKGMRMQTRPEKREHSISIYTAAKNEGQANPNALK